MPEACFTFEAPANLENGDTVKFTNCSTGGSTYLWDFGDSTTSREVNPQHVYKNMGEYTVTLSCVTGNAKKTHTVSQMITANLKLPTAIVINKIVLDSFPDTFIEPDIFLNVYLDSVLILASGQVHTNCKQGVGYPFDEGFPLTFTGDEGLYGKTGLEFRSLDSANGNPVVGRVDFSMIAAYYNYVSNGSIHDSVGFVSSSGIGFFLYPEFIF